MQQNALRKKMSREDLFEDLKEKIINSPNHEVEIAAIEYAKKYGVQGPTIDYHIEHLVKEGHLIRLDKLGKYKRKIYTLPEYSHQNDDIETGLGESESFLNFIKNATKEIETKSLEENETVPVENEIETTKEEPEEPFEIDNKDISEEKLNDDTQINNNEFINEFNSESNNFMESNDLTLDDKINMFLNKSSQVYDATELLKHKDKEILSVMHETIQKNMIYLKDLSDELTTAENRKLIQALIEERNSMKNEMSELQNELKELRDQQLIQANAKIEPARIREMQQRLIGSVDRYLKSSNADLALNRKEFREEFMKELSYLANYAVGVNKF